MKKNLKKGFTLIELLVVIAIIGILSAVVLASLSTDRAKASDAKVQGQLSSMRSAAEIYYSSAGNYSTTGNCQAASTMFSNDESGMNGPVDSTANVVCGSNGSAWQASAPLSANAWCVDSSGASRRIGSVTANTVFVCSAGI